MRKGENLRIQRMVWEIQPDGRYWEDDDGFGGESDLEILLYTYLDDKGNFTGSFRTYSIGGEEFVRKGISDN